jgi:hypothetical protein
MARTPGSWTFAFGLSVLGALVLWLGIAALSPGYVADIESRKARSKWVTEEGVENAYRMRIDYPPGNLYLFAAVGNIYQSLVDPRFDRQRAAESQFLTWLIKVPPTLFHLATGVVVFLLVRARTTERRAWLAGTLLLFDPAAIFDVAHQGQYDPVHTLFSLLSITALVAGHPALAGASIAVAALTKPQSWILLPLVAAIAWRRGSWSGLVRAGLGGVAALLIGLAPFILNDRLHHLPRLLEYMNTNSPANRVISANAHNLWWLPTLVQGRWIEDSEPLLGLLSYRWIGAGLVLLVLSACLARVVRRGPEPDYFLLAAALGAGWFFFTPRAHEYHAFFVLPFLAVVWPNRARLLLVYCLASLGLLANLALHDPLVVGALAAPPSPEAPLPVLYQLATLVNVAVFLALVVALWRLAGLVPTESPAVRWRAAAASG